MLSQLLRHNQRSRSWFYVNQS